MSLNHALYLCYFGLREPLVQTQVLPYLREINKIDGLKLVLLTFEPNPNKTWTKFEIEQEKKKLDSEGIEWHFLTYHKRPSLIATGFDILNGAFFAWKLARKRDISIFHGRVHVPALMGWLAIKFLRRKPKLLFDIRGFFPEEYVDAGIWKENGFTFNLLKSVERRLLRDADAFVTLTERARDILFPESKKSGFDKNNKPVEVIPCCVDLKKFNSLNNGMRTVKRRELGIENRFVIAYVGSFGGYYMTCETADFLGAAKKRKPNTFALILTQSKPEMIEPLIKKQGFTEGDYIIQKVSPTEIPQFLSAADIALSFIKPSYSKLASSPTKNAEYLACGLPLVANKYVGDVFEQVINDNTGVIINSFSMGEFQNALTKIDELIESKDIAERCRRSAKSRFDLETVAGKKYRRIYSLLLPKL